MTTQCLICTPHAETVAKLTARNSLYAISWVAFDWLVILAAIAYSEIQNHPAITGLCLVVIASRQNAMLVLMHEAAHGMLCSRRWLNDLLSNVFLAFPLCTSTEGYRYFHLAHHRFLNTEKDPDWVYQRKQPHWSFPTSGLNYFRRLCIVSALGSVANVKLSLAVFRASSKAKGSWPSEMHRASCAAFWVIVVILSLWAGVFQKLLLYWGLPPLVFLPLMFYVRSVAEHQGLPNDHVASSSRSINASLIERLFIAPHRVSCHLEHHVFPGIPHFRLKTVMKSIRDCPSCSAQAGILGGYFCSRDGRPSVYSQLTAMVDSPHQNGVHQQWQLN